MAAAAAADNGRWWQTRISTLKFDEGQTRIQYSVHTRCKPQSTAIGLGANYKREWGREREEKWIFGWPVFLPHTGHWWQYARVLHCYAIAPIRLLVVKSEGNDKLSYLLLSKDYFSQYHPKRLVTVNQICKLCLHCRGAIIIIIIIPVYGLQMASN